MVFMIDSLPSQADRGVQLEARQELIEYFRGRNAVSLRDLDVVKTEAVLQEDLVRAARLEGELRLEERLLESREATVAADPNGSRAARLRAEVTKLTLGIATLRDEIYERRK